MGLCTEFVLFKDNILGILSLLYKRQYRNRWRGGERWDMQQRSGLDLIPGHSKTKIFLTKIIPVYYL